MTRNAYLRASWTSLLVLAALAGCGRQDKVITRLDEAREARIGVMTGSTGEATTRARLPRADIKSYDDIMDAAAAMKAGQLEALVISRPAAIQLVKYNPDFQLVAEPLDNEDTAIALRRKDTALLAAVNRFIDSLRADGTLADMKRRWFKPDLSPYEEPAIAVPATGEILDVGVSATREPMTFVDRDGRVSGHDGELARRLGARLGRPVAFHNMKFMALIPALQSGKVDVIVTGMTATDERRKQVAFSHPYYANAQVMVVRKQAAGRAFPAAAGGTSAASGKLTSAKDLAAGRVGVLLGSAHEAWALKNLPKATVLQYKTFADLVLAVRTGKVDGALFDADPLRDLVRRDRELGILGGPLFSFDCGVGFSSGADDLRGRFNSFLAELRRNGVYDDMVHRWIVEGATDMPAIRSPHTRGILTAGVSDVGLPFVAMRENRLVGFDVELAERFAAHLGRELRLANMDFGSLVAAVSTGKADLIASSIYITPEREEQIDFSEPYYRMDTLVLARKANIASGGVDAAAGGSGAAAGDGGSIPRATTPSFLSRIVDSFEANLLREGRYRLILDGLRTTALISVLATLLGTLLGALVCFMRMSRRSLLHVPAKVYISILRGTPVLVLLMLVFYVVFASVNISPVLVAVIAFGLNFAAYVAEIFRSGIEGIDRGQTEAGLSLGFTRVATFAYIVLPQTVQRILPVYKGEFISLVKMTSIVGYIAVQDLTKASDIIRSRTFDAFFPLVMVAILYFAISWLLLQGLGYLERGTDPKLRRRREARA
ncbi:MAG: ABC transporter permease subunit [Bacteroidota bacterium]